MDPTTVFCPNPVCPARGHVSQGHISIHSRSEKRFICTQCHKTFAATKGTVFYRLRTSTELVVIRRADGGSLGSPGRSAGPGRPGAPGGATARLGACTSR
jgi:transposase-like protein